MRKNRYSTRKIQIWMRLLAAAGVMLGVLLLANPPGVQRFTARLYVLVDMNPDFFLLWPGPKVPLLQPRIAVVVLSWAAVVAACSFATSRFWALAASATMLLTGGLVILAPPFEFEFAVACAGLWVLVSAVPMLYASTLHHEVPRAHTR